ncbi:MAG TPA: S1 RNA-binding domain-containing protein, partial [Acidimicrobiia bacterium]
MSNPQENASVAAPENEETVETPETPAAEENAEEAASTPESETAPEAADSSAPETTEPAAAAPEATTEEASSDESDGEAAQGRYVEREALVAPDLSDLPDDIGDDFERAIEATVLEFREGDIVEGTIVNVDSEGALVDIGYKSEGFIPTRELSIRNNIDPEETVEVGDRVESVVLDKEDDEGRLILSKKRAMYERAWGQIQKIADEDGTVEGTVIEVVKGGLIVDIGLRGFLPASLVDLRRVRDLDPFIGESITA